MKEDNNKESKSLKENLDNLASEAAKASGNAVEAVKDMGEKVLETTPEVAKKVVDKANDAVDAIKEGTSNLLDRAHKEKVRLDKFKLQPVFPDDIHSEKFTVPTMVRIVDYDKKHMESEACIGSIGFWDTLPKGNTRILNIYTKFANEVGLNFYPNVVESLYYIAPFENSKYVDIGDYFHYEEKLRVAELNDIASALGAKLVRINILEEKASYAKKKSKEKAAVDTPAASASGEMVSEDDSQSFELKEQGSEINLGGNNNPSMPKLKYYANDPDVLSLINIRMNKENTITNKTYKLRYNASSLIRKNQAAQLDTALEMYSMAGNASISASYEEQTRMRFEYYIEFPETEDKD